MDTEALKTFVAIHRAGGFSAAASGLNRSQPAVSRRIALLESELGAPLFERVAGGVVISQIGQTLLPHAERVLAALRDAGDAVDAVRRGEAGPLTLAAVGTLAGTNLTTALRRFAVRYPNVDLSLRTATSDEVSDLVRRGEATVGLRYFDDGSPDLICRALAAEAQVVVCGPAHPLAGNAVRSLTARALVGLPPRSSAPRGRGRDRLRPVPGARGRGHPLDPGRQPHRSEAPD